MPTLAKPKVVVIGAGAAGVFSAYLLEKHAPGRFDITILEKNGAIGGNTRGQWVQWQGESIHIDCGAQFFSESSEPEYCDMLRDEGFFAQYGLITESAAGMTVWNASTRQLEFRVPDNIPDILRGVEHHFLDWMNFLDLTLAAIEAYFAEDWSKTFGVWIDGIRLWGSRQEQEAFKRNIARPLMYQFGLVRPADLDALSAKFVIYYYVGSLPWPHHGAPPVGAHPDGTAPFHVYTCSRGMDSILEALRDKYRLCVQTRSPVQSIEPQGDGYVVTTAGGAAYPADEIIFGTNPKWTLGLLPDAPSFDPLRTLLGGMQYLTVPVQVQRGATSSYTTPDAATWEVSNVTLVEDTNGAASNYMLTVWFGPLKSESIGRQFFKSWGSPNLVPPDQPVFIEQIHQLMVGTPDFIARRDQLRTAFQGASSLWYAGGYILDYDTQNTCLKSAQNVVRGILNKHVFEPLAPDRTVLVAEDETRTRLDPTKDRPPLLDAIEKALLALDVEHEALAAFKASRS
jgi:predicted NAD/FAD-binding protein